MSDITFVRPRHDYGSYSDFYALVRLSGYPLIYVDSMDAYDPTKCYILSPANGEWGDGWPGARARIIHWQIEWEFEPAPLHNGVAEKWTSDKYHAEKIGARFVPMGSHRELNCNPGERAEKVYDVIFLAAQAYRRYQVWGDIEERGLKIAPNGWGDERHAAMLRSKCMVVVHQWDEFPCIAPLRWCLAAAYSLPIVSETLRNRAPFGEGHFMSCRHDMIGEFVAMHVSDQFNWLENYGHALYQKLCVEMTFKASVEAAV